MVYPALWLGTDEVAMDKQRIKRILSEWREKSVPCGTTEVIEGWKISSGFNIVKARFPATNPLDGPVKGWDAFVYHKGWEHGNSAEPQIYETTFVPDSWHCTNCGYPDESIASGEHCPSCGM